MLKQKYPGLSETGVPPYHHFLSCYCIQHPILNNSFHFFSWFDIRFYFFCRNYFPSEISPLLGFRSMVIISNIVAKVFFETIKSRAFKDQRFEYFFFFLHFFRFGDHIWHTRKLNHWSCKSKGIFSKFNFLVKFKQNWKLRSARDIEYNWNILICTLWYDEEIKFKIKCGGFLLVGYLRAYFITLATSKARVDHNDQYETQLSLQKGIVPK